MCPSIPWTASTVAPLSIASAAAARHAWSSDQTNETIRLALAAGVDADWLLDRLRP